MEKGVSGSCSTQVIIAALNEEAGIGLTIAELVDCLGSPRIVVVDGRSCDRTVEVSKSLGAEVLVQDGMGKGDALAKAIEHLDGSADYVVITDADFTYPAQYLPEMIQALDKNPDIGMVCGNRFDGSVDKQALLRVFYAGNRLISLVHRVINGVHLEDPLTGLRVVRAGILQGWKMKSKGFDVEVELNNLVEQRGFKIIEVPIHYRVRLGEKKLKARHGLTILRRMIMERTPDMDVSGFFRFLSSYFVAYGQFVLQLLLLDLIRWSSIIRITL